MPSLPIVTILYKTNSLLNISNDNSRYLGIRETSKILPFSKSINADIYSLNSLYLSKYNTYINDSIVYTEQIQTDINTIQMCRFRILWRIINVS